VEFLREQQGIDQDSDVVEQSGKVQFFVIFHGELLGKVLADQRCAHGVAPECDRRHAVFKAEEKFGQAAGIDQIANAGQAQCQNRLTHCLDTVAPPEQRGVRDAKALHGQRFVVRNQFDHAAHIHLGRALAQAFRQRAEHRWHRRQIIQLIYLFGQDALRSGIHFAPPGSSPGAGFQ
jgi:hypothetical protein